MNHSHSTQITDRYLEHFTPNEFRFRWLDATACDLDLSRRGNHLAARIFTLWFESNHTRTSYAELQRITAMSRKTLERALPELVERGWISVTHQGSNIEIGLAMSEHGLDLLLEERERRQSFAGRRTTNDEWTDRIIARLVTTLELHPEKVAGLPRWRLLRTRIRSIVSHMLCYETESQKLFNTLTESLPTSIQDPAGFLLSRAGEHIRLHPHLSARAPRPKNGSSARFIETTIAGITNSLAATTGSTDGPARDRAD